MSGSKIWINLSMYWRIWMRLRNRIFGSSNGLRFYGTGGMAFRSLHGEPNYPQITQISKNRKSCEQGGDLIASACVINLRNLWIIEVGSTAGMLTRAANAQGPGNHLKCCR